jgi:membrane protein implicated in regulation of membrane protease activity
MLRGSNWARWLAIAWLAYHVVLSAFHGWQETIVHFLFFAGVAYLLFRPNASAYFGRSKKVW